MNKNREEMKNTVSEMKNTQKELKSGWMKLRTESVSWKTIEKEIPRQSNKLKRLWKNDDSLRELQNNGESNNICIIRISEGEDKEEGIRNLFEKLMTENIPNLVN